MRAVKLHFRNDSYLTTLLANDGFKIDINYLSPYKIDNNNIVLFDPVTQHDPLDTEMVVLSKFARAIKNIIFPTTNSNIEFLNPILGQQKGGLVHDRLVIIDSTDLERMAINITARQL
ncbi:hypothetical protein [Flavobacterium sp.]|uniref:hypothetical protein n=1 Tax=Flavobacterium sp. TaxID=239 RepID=UPI0025B977E3|nr:hypothetical protein [Flavobacterium sp.]